MKVDREIHRSALARGAGLVLDGPVRRLLLLGIAAFTACGGSSGDGPGDATDRSQYPAGPYGKAEGQVIEPLSFVNPDGSTLSLSTVFADPSRRLLLLVTASGWCTACVEEQPALEELHGRHGPEGLAIIEAVFEDANFVAATAEDAEQWKRQYGLTFDLVADPDFVLGAYYDRQLSPMNMMVDVDTMKILRIGTGWDPTATEALIEARLK